VKKKGEAAILSDFVKLGCLSTFLKGGEELRDTSGKDDQQAGCLLATLFWVWDSRAGARRKQRFVTKADHHANSKSICHLLLLNFIWIS
jgi:hypothetical protein